MKTKKRYIVELTEAEIGYVSMSLENTQTTLQENSYGKRLLPIMDRAINQIRIAMQNGMKTVKK